MRISKCYQRGFEGLPPMWRRSFMAEFRRTFPRSDEPWKIAEDRRLLRAFEQQKAVLAKLPRGQRYAWWMSLARPFGRTKEAVQARVYALLAGQRVTAAKR